MVRIIHLRIFDRPESCVAPRGHFVELARSVRRGRRTVGLRCHAAYCSDLEIVLATGFCCFDVAFGWVIQTSVNLDRRLASTSHKARYYYSIEMTFARPIRRRPIALKD